MRVFDKISSILHKDIGYRKFIALSAIAPLCLIGVFAFMYLYDPLQLYHKPYFGEPKYIKDMRIQARGIIAQGDYDSYIIGTSMLENTSAKETSEILGGKWVNVSLSGSSFDERKVVLDYIFRINKPKHIIYSLDVYRMIGVNLVDTSNFDYLYDEDRNNDFKIYFSKKYTRCAFKTIFSFKNQCANNNDLETLIVWILESSHKDRFGGFKQWLKNRDNIQIKDDINYLGKLTLQDLANFKLVDFTESIESNKEYLQKYLLDLIRANPQTQFSLIIPTYSRFDYKKGGYHQDFAYFSHWSKVVKWFVAECENLPNATIYGFDDTEYPDDIANYKDAVHYNADMNVMQLQAIADKTHIVDSKNIDTYLSTMKEKIESYDLTPLVKMAKESKK